MSRLDVAREFLEDARLCLHNGRFRSAASRAYYAVFHACIVLFEYHGYRPQHFLGREGRPARRWEHGVIVRYFPIEFVHRRKIISWPQGIGVRILYEARIKADYRPDIAVSKRAAQESVTRAEQILATIERVV